jgi:hypothetical protein
MPARRVEFTVSQETWQRIEAARGAAPRAAWIKLAIEKKLAQAEKKKPRA